MPPATQGTECRSAFVTYRDGEETEDASIAAVLAGRRESGGTAGSKVRPGRTAEWDVYLLRSDRTLLLIGHQFELYLPILDRFPDWRLNWPHRTFGWPRDVAERALGIQASRAGGTTSFDPGYFSDRWIERAGDRYCVAYRMRHPFSGTLRNCGGPEGPSGEVGYAPGVTTWREAVDAACRAVPSVVGRSSQGNSTEHCDYHGPFLATPIRDGDESLAYVVAHSPPLQWNMREYLLFRVEAVDGSVALVGRSNERPDVWDAHAQRRL